MNKEYKQSRYNYFIDYKGKVLLFNGITGAGFCMTKDEKERLSSLLCDLNHFKTVYPSDFDKMIKLGCVVDAGLDEVALVKYMNKKVSFDNQRCSVTINPTMDCNFQCWYCYESHNDSEMSDKVIESIRLYARHMIEDEKVKSFDLSWFGGEPLLKFNQVVYPISEYVQNLCIKNHVSFQNGITTNGYCIDQEVAQKLAAINMSTFQITLDGNRERHDKIRNVNGTPSFDRIIHNIETLCSSIDNVLIILRLNYDKVTLNFSPSEILNEFSQNARSHIRIDLHRVWQTVDGTVDSALNSKIQAFIEEARSKEFRCWSSGGLSPRKFHNCYVCRDNFKVINYDGNIFKCTARDFTPENSVGRLNENGEIEWDRAKISALYGHSPMETKECLECDILPLCMGPCPQRFMESKYNVNSSCTWRLEERTINDMIIDLYENSLKDFKMKKK